MAAGDRSKQIRVKVQRILGNRGETNEAGLASAIFEVGDRIQRRIAEETLCLEDKTDLTVVDELHPFPDGMINERKLIPDGSVELKKINFEDVDRLKRSFNSTDISDDTSTNLFYYYKWNGNFGFLLASGAPPSSEIDVTCYFWRYPDEASEKMSNTVDPVVGIKWDTAIFYGIVAEMMGLPAWDEKFEREFQRQKDREKVTLQEHFQVPYNSDYD